MRRIVLGAGLMILAALAISSFALFVKPFGEQAPAGVPSIGVGETQAAPVFGVAPAVSLADLAQPTGITVAGEGVAKAQPDVAYLTAGVQNTASSAQQAQQDNARLMNAVLAKLESMGFAKNDLRTTGLSLHPVYDKPGETPTGYQAINQVVVTVNDVGQAGTVFDSVVGAGANVAGNIRFGLKNDAPLRQQALREAVKAARVKADAIAAEMGVTVTGVEAVVEESAGGTPIPMRDEAMPATAAGAPPTTVMPGELTVTSRVRVIYKY